MLLHTKRTTSWGNRRIYRVQRANGRPCSGSGWGVESGRRLVYGRSCQVRTPRLSVHGRTEGALREVLQRSLQTGGRQDRATLRLPARPLPIAALAAEHAGRSLRLRAARPVSLAHSPRTLRLCDSVRDCVIYWASVRPSECTPEGQVAQLVEHRTENAGVAGSIPALATNFARRQNPAA